MYYSLVIDAFYINKQYEQEGIIGKGKDFVHGISSTIYLVRDRKDSDKEKGKGQEENAKKHALQIYEGLTDQIYQIKVQQLQLAMTERVTNYTTRIQLIGSKKLNKTTYDLYVLYEFDEFTQNISQLPALKDEKEAKQFLAFLCSNLMIQGKYTNEFLDISPYNIYKNNGNKDYEEYVVTNFGLNFKGSKFHSYYYPTTDNFYKEKQKSIQSTIYSYSFQAALVTLYFMTKIDPRNFFFEDGQFKDRLAMSIISLLKTKPEGEKEDQKKQYDQKLADVQKQLIPAKLKAGEENPAKKIVLERTYTKEFLSLLSQLLQLDHSKRSIFPQLIKYNQDEKINPLDLQERYFDEQDNFKQKGQQNIYVGFGKLEDKQVTPHGIGFGEKEVTLKTKVIKKIDPKTKQPIYGDEKEIKTFQKYFGNYENGEPKGIGCTVLRDGTHLLAYILSEKWIIVISDPMELPNALYKPLGHIWFGIYDQNFHPQGKGQLIMIQNHDQNLPKKFTAVCFSGEVVDGQKKYGTEHYQAKNYFLGDFLFNIPSKGVMAYSEDHFYEGTFQDFKRKSGTLFFGQQVFEGTFANDKISQGILKYENSSEYDGQFKNGLRDGKGTLTYQNQKLIYEGTFENNKMHGSGKFKFNGNEYEVDFEKGKLQTTDLPADLLKEFDRVRFNKPVQEEEDEEIPEVIEDGQDEGHDMDDSEESG